MPIPIHAMLQTDSITIICFLANSGPLFPPLSLCSVLPDADSLLADEREAAQPHTVLQSGSTADQLSLPPPSQDHQLLPLLQAHLTPQ